MAEGFFIGADVGRVTYPDYTNELVNGLVASGATFASARQDAASFTVGIHGGQWVNQNFGWEAGFTDLGSISGSFNSNLVNGSGNYKYSASAIYASALGGIPLGRGKLFGKAGLFSATTKLSGTFGAFLLAPQDQSSTGVLLGGGYELRFNDKISGRAGLDLYNGVKFSNVWSGVVESKTLVQVGVGVNFTF
jgi:hypothetical protein